MSKTEFSREEIEQAVWNSSYGCEEGKRNFLSTLGILDVNIYTVTFTYTDSYENPWPDEYELRRNIEQNFESSLCDYGETISRVVVEKIS